MKLLMTTDTVGGVWTYAMELCGALSKSGVEVALATKGQRLSADQRNQLRPLTNVQAFESDFRLEWMPDPWDDVERSSEWMLRLAGELKPDLIHLNDFAHGALAFGAPKLVVGHSCVLSWWEAVRRTPLPDQWNRYRRLVRASLRGADAVAAPSKAMLAALSRHYGPHPRMRVLLNGRNIGLTRTTRKEPLVLAAGRLWDEAKNVSALESIAPQLPWPVYLAGEGGGENRAERNGARFLGKLRPDELAPWFAAASIYAFPARYEPFGLSILEAAQAGCALVLGDIESLRELWEGAALFVPPDDKAALKHAIVTLADNPHLRAEWVRKSRMRALSLTPEAMASGYLHLYRELLVASSEIHEEARACAW